MNGLVCTGDAVNLDHPLNRGLVSWWLALPDQQRGVIFRDLCMRNHGTLVNSPLWEGDRGKPGGCGSLLFNGSTQYVENASPTPSASTMPTLTIACWYRISAHRNFHIYVAHGTYTNGYDFYSSTLGYLFFQLKTASGSWEIRTDTTIPADGHWHHIACVYDGTNTVAIYLDGVGQALTGGGGTPPSGSISASGSLYLGSDLGGTSYLLGSLDDVRIYGRHLDAREVAELYVRSAQWQDGLLNVTHPARYAPTQVSSSFLSAWAKNSNVLLTPTVI